MHCAQIVTSGMKTTIGSTKWTDGDVTFELDTCAEAQAEVGRLLVVGGCVFSALLLALVYVLLACSGIVSSIGCVVGVFWRCY